MAGRLNLTSQEVQLPVGGRQCGEAPGQVEGVRGVAGILGGTPRITGERGNSNSVHWPPYWQHLSSALNFPGTLNQLLLLLYTSLSHAAFLCSSAPSLYLKREEQGTGGSCQEPGHGLRPREIGGTWDAAGGWQVTPGSVWGGADRISSQ